MNKDFRWPVTVKRDIAAPATKVWQVISAPGNLEACHPYCRSNPVHQWPGPDSRDEVHYFSGWIYHRQFNSWIDGSGYDLEIGRSGGAKSSVSWRIEPVDETSCTLTISVCSSALQRYPLVIRWLPYLLRVRPMLRKYLRSVVMGVEWNATRGESVTEDQFGRHPWFSAR
jgi:hypothetical protein